jgi:hypothetical protein
MRKLFICISLLLTSLSYGQEQTKAIKLLPDVGQGFLVLSNPNDQVVSWDVKIGELIRVNDSTSRTNLLFAIELHDIDYLRVPDDILNGNKNLFFSVVGLSSTKQVVVSEEDIIISAPDVPNICACV